MLNIWNWRHLHGFRYECIFEKTRLALLRAEIKRLRFELNSLSIQVRDLHLKLSSCLNSDIWFRLDSHSFFSVESSFNQAIKTQSLKFSHLSHGSHPSLYLSSQSNSSPLPSTNYPFNSNSHALPLQPPLLHMLPFLLSLNVPNLKTSPTSPPKPVILFLLFILLPRLSTFPLSP